MHTISLAMAMAFGGIAGGFASYIITPIDEENNTKIPKWSYVILLGVIVAFTVPLFLSLAQSRLVEDITNPANPNKSVGANVLVLMGFCIVAAFSARRFLENLSERVLADLKKTKAKVEDNAEQIEKLDEALEKNIPAPQPPNEAENLIPQTGAPLILNELPNIYKVLYATSLNTKRTLSGISKDSGLTREETQKIIHSAISKGFIEITVSDRTGGRRFRLTPAGTAELTRQAVEYGPKTSH